MSCILNNFDTFYMRQPRHLLYIFVLFKYNFSGLSSIVLQSNNYENTFYFVWIQTS